MTQSTGNPRWLVYDDGTIEELRAGTWRDYLKTAAVVALSLALSTAIAAAGMRFMLRDFNASTDKLDAAISAASAGPIRH